MAHVSKRAKAIRSQAEVNKTYPVADALKSV
jgi:hypothetical protein